VVRLLGRNPGIGEEASHTHLAPATAGARSPQTRSVDNGG